MREADTVPACDERPLSLDSDLGRQEPQATSWLELHPEPPAGRGPDFMFSKGPFKGLTQHT